MLRLLHAIPTYFTEYGVVLMVIALLALPSAAAASLTKRLWQAMILASAFTGVCMVGGLTLSYKPNLPAGATIIVVAGIVYLLVLVLRPAGRAAGRGGSQRRKK